MSAGKLKVSWNLAAAAVCCPRRREKAYPMRRSPADERAVIKEKLDEAQQGLLKSKSSDTSAVDGGTSLLLVSCRHLMCYVDKNAGGMLPFTTLWPA